MDASTVASWLLEFSIRPLALWVAALAAIALFHVKSPAARHAIWSAVAGGMLLLAAIAVLLPSLPLRLLPALPTLAAPVSVTLHLAQPTAPLEPSSRPWDWERIAAGVYLAGLLAFALRLAYSYRLTHRLVRAARPLPQFEGMRVLESEVIAVPATLGWRHPKILVPTEWSTWPADKLEAVMIHERTHVARGDWAVALVAGVNRCVFWFHPLSWWIERRLALLAEMACDDASLAAVASRTAYAEALVDMAAAVRRGGGRVNWEAMAMARHSEVRLRVERILDESRQILPALARAHWIALRACALPLIYLAAAVRPARVRAQQTESVPQAQTAPQAAPQPASETTEKLAELLREQERSLSLTQQRLAEAEQQAELLRQKRAELENKRSRANEAALEADRIASEQTLQLQQQIEFTQRMEALKTQIAAMSEQLTPNHPSLKRAQAELAALQLRASRVPADPAAARDFLQFEIERLNAQLQEKRKELEIFNAAAPASAAGPGAPALIFKRSPEYTSEALKEGIEGRVDLDVTISEGRVTNVKVVHGIGYGLDQRAIECVKTWRWQSAAGSQNFTVAVLFKLPAQK